MCLLAEGSFAWPSDVRVSVPRHLFRHFIVSLQSVSAYSTASRALARTRLSAHVVSPQQADPIAAHLMMKHCSKSWFKGTLPHSEEQMPVAVPNTNPTTGLRASTPRPIWGLVAGAVASRLHNFVLVINMEALIGVGSSDECKKGKVAHGKITCAGVGGCWIRLCWIHLAVSCFVIQMLK